MDIQPCGSNEGIAFYVAQYISKAEPTQVDASVAQALRQIQREESNISWKLFKPEKRYRVLQFNEAGQAAGYCSNIFDRYEKRPVEHADYDFNNMSLLEFAMLFGPYYAKRQDNNEERCLTLHSVLKLPVQKDGRIVDMPILTGNYLRLMRQQWRDIEFMFIDEISMVPYEMLCMIDSRQKQLKHSEELFGDINMLLFGNLMQLPPVRGNQVFDQPLRLAPATHLWRRFTLVELTENMRQQGNASFVDIFNALRIGELQSEHFVELISKVNTSRVATGEFSIGKALRIYLTNQQANDHNQAVLEHFRAKGTTMFKTKAQDGDEAVNAGVLPVCFNTLLRNIIVSAEQRRNGAEYLRENPPTSGIVWHDSLVRKFRSDLAGNRALFTLGEGELSNHYPTAAPYYLVLRARLS
ncbi:hypothetical protein PR048_008622 [Dryococelus australis]|uniref:ATP-dependent DNA helicase n=1 Tax=Dryococelus australis TaxID=614101 RepID=A0ABQ9HXN1_9NEOP|nr:hypothetical protein PR048_008622 [Dryococelus australis]